MKTLYFDCGMGAAGDMLMASLYEICPDKAEIFKDHERRWGCRDSPLRRNRQ